MKLSRNGAFKASLFSPTPAAAGISPTNSVKSSKRTWRALPGSKKKSPIGSENPQTNSAEPRKGKADPHKTHTARIKKNSTGLNVAQSSDAKLPKKSFKGLKRIEKLLATAAGRYRLATALTIDWSQTGLPLDPETISTGASRKKIQRALQGALSNVSKPFRRTSAPIDVTSADIPSSEALDELSDVDYDTSIAMPTTPTSKACLLLLWAADRIAAASPGLELDFQISAYASTPGYLDLLASTAIEEDPIQLETEEEPELPMTPRTRYACISWRLRACVFVNHFAHIAATYAAAGPAPIDAVFIPLREAAALAALQRRLSHVPCARLLEALAAKPHIARYVWLAQRGDAERAAARALGAKAHRAQQRAETKAARRMRVLEVEEELERLDDEALIFDSTVDAPPASPVKKVKKAVKNAGKGLATFGAAVKKGVAAAKPTTLLAKAKESWAEGKARRRDAKVSAKMADFLSDMDTISAAPAAAAPVAETPTRVEVTAGVAPAAAKSLRGLGRLAARLRKGGEAAKASVRALAAALPKGKKEKGWAKAAPTAPAAAAATPVPSPSKLAILASPAAAFLDDEPASPSFRIPAVRPAAARALAF